MMDPVASTGGIVPQIIGIVNNCSVEEKINFVDEVQNGMHKNQLPPGLLVDLMKLSWVSDHI